MSETSKPQHDSYSFVSPTYGTAIRFSFSAHVDSDLRSLQVNDALTFESTKIQFSGTNEVMCMRDIAGTDGVVLAIMFSSTSGVQVSGNAVMVAAGVAITAAHLFRDDIAALRTGELEILCVGHSAGSQQHWGPTGITFVPETDLAILSLTLINGLPAGGKFRFASLTTRMPRKGELVSIAGFVPSKEDNDEWEPGGKIRSYPLVSRGKVVQQYAPRRDTVLMRWPALEIDCPSWGGMSGAPVFDLDGWLIGLLSTSISTEDTPKPSFVSLVWGALGWPFAGGWPCPTPDTERTLLHMADKTCAIERPNALEMQYGSDGAPTGFKYYRWHDR